MYMSNYLFLLYTSLSNNGHEHVAKVRSQFVLPTYVQLNCFYLTSVLYDITYQALLFLACNIEKLGDDANYRQCPD